MDDAPPLFLSPSPSAHKPPYFFFSGRGRERENEREKHPDGDWAERVGRLLLTPSTVCIPYLSTAHKVGVYYSTIYHMQPRTCLLLAYCSAVQPCLSSLRWVVHRHSGGCFCWSTCCWKYRFGVGSSHCTWMKSPWWICTQILVNRVHFRC